MIVIVGLIRIVILITIMNLTYQIIGGVSMTLIHRIPYGWKVIHLDILNISLSINFILNILKDGHIISLQTN